ncbi:MAG: tetrahydromethanopterin S-methyltransferase subunit H [Methermicoccaceae archaeon]
MLRFKTEQKEYVIRDVHVGGQPGDVPCVLCGSMFYERHSLVEDAKKGVFDKRKAQELICRQSALSDETGIPCMVAVYGSTKEAIEQYIDFVSSVDDCPIVLDSTDAEVRAHAATYASEVGLADVCVYNSINMGIKQDEMDALTHSDVEAAIVLAFNPKGMALDGRLAMLESGDGLVEDGLLALAEQCGITKPLIDPSATALGNHSGVVLRMTMAVKAKYGMPTGSGIHNVVSSWGWLRERRKSRPDAFVACDAATIALQIAACGDFVLYGPIEYAEYAFPCASMCEVMMAEASEYARPVSGHPSERVV